MREVDSIFLNGAWLSVGGSAPWGVLTGTIKTIKISFGYPEPNTDIIEVKFDDDSVLTYKAKNDYMFVEYPK